MFFLKKNYPLLLELKITENNIYEDSILELNNNLFKKILYFLRFNPKNNFFYEIYNYNKIKNKLLITIIRFNYIREVFKKMTYNFMKYINKIKKTSSFYRKRKKIFKKIFILCFIKDFFKLSNKPFFSKFSNFNLKKKYFKKKKKLKSWKNKNFWFINIYIIAFLEFFLKKKVFLKFKKIRRYKLTFNLKKFFNKILRRFRKYNFILKKNFFFKDFLEIFSILIKYKELDLFVRWFRFNFERFNRKQQKKFLNFFKNFFKKFFTPIKSKYGVYGIYFSLKGKVCVQGNAKSRKYFFKYGAYSRTTKNIKYLYKSEIIRTHTGVLGLKLMLIFD